MSQHCKTSEFDNDGTLWKARKEVLLDSLCDRDVHAGGVTVGMQQLWVDVHKIMMGGGIAKLFHNCVCCVDYFKLAILVSAPDGQQFGEGGAGHGSQSSSRLSSSVGCAGCGLSNIKAVPLT
jgi:hypothetical protein